MRSFYIKGLSLLVILFFAIFYPSYLISFFTYGFSPVKVYHLLWFITVLILLKRFIPKFNKKINLGKIYGRNFVMAGEDNPSKKRRLIDYVKKVNAGAIRTAVYWIALLLTIGFWKLAGLLDTMWLLIIVFFFIFMDQFCITVWCPFQAIIGNKCCNTCRINNWGYLMAFSPMVYIPSFWTYSILALSVLAIIQWEYIFYRHPERFYELYNANLMCRNCSKRCKRREKKRSNEPGLD
ncbi:MAG: hypothetical protein N2745_02650 [Syntrophorhabdaceae bacterium]|nr:hypothetical protein [Syntrophorhabdaceae bacterium]